MESYKMSAFDAGVAANLLQRQGTEEEKLQLAGAILRTNPDAYRDAEICGAYIGSDFVSHPELTPGKEHDLETLAGVFGKSRNLIIMRRDRAFGNLAADESTRELLGRYSHRT